ncbi:hypothetical protein HN011_002456 [Eciton burchellii]|nr:hypothetical protein HN011_002456 [Eciton burchellii]
MAPFHGMALLILGIGYLLHAEPFYGKRDIAFLHLNDDTFGKEEKSQRSTKKAHFFKDTPQKLTVAIGQAAVLLCRVKNLGNRTVSWIRKRDLHILTSMAVTYTSDARFAIVGNPETDYWNLQIDYVQPRDAGIYECQVNTEPKIYRAVTLKVLDIQARITGSQELYIKKGSTISLTCIIELQDLPPSNVTWYHAGAVIDFDGPRGGVSLETEKGKRGTTSKLLITRAQLNDSGNYTCASSKVTPASVMVHVLNGEQNTAVASGKRMERDCAIANFEILHSA